MNNPQLFAHWVIVETFRVLAREEIQYTTIETVYIVVYLSMDG